MGKETGGRYTLIKVLEPEGEAFWVLLEGEMTFEVGDETIKASPGSFVFGPRDLPHRIGAGEAHPTARRRSRLVRRRWSSQ